MRSVKMSATLPASGAASAQKGALEAPLKRGHRVRLRVKKPLQVLDRLDQWIGLHADGRGVCAVEHDAHVIEPAAQALTQPVKGFHGKKRAEGFRRRLQRRARRQAGQQSCEQRRADTVPWQHRREIHRQGSSATAAPAAVGAKSALPAGALPVGALRIVPLDQAVAVQRATPATVGAALPLERKSSVCNAGSSRTNRTLEGGIRP